MSSLSSINVGLKALLAAQSGLDTAGHNVANAATSGYSRQEVMLTSAGSQILRGIAVGNGVEAGSVRRLSDLFIGRRLATSSGMLSYLDSRVNGLGQIESLYGEPGSDGLSSKMQALFASFSSLASNPTEPSLRQGVVSSGIDLTKRFHALAAGFGELTSGMDLEIGGAIDQVNALATGIASLNRSIVSFEASGEPANDLRDQRDEAVKSLSAFVDVRTNDSPNGAVTVQVSGQLLVGPSTAYTMKSTKDSQGNTVMSIAGHAGTFVPRAGSIAGMLSVANDVTGKRTQEIDALAHDLVFQLNRAHSTGVPSSGPMKSLTSAFAVHDPDGNGIVINQTLADSGLDFNVSQGKLRVSVTNATTKQVETTTIAIDPDSMTVGDLVSALDGIAHLSATLGADGRLSMNADAGFGFDFAQRIAASPDVNGTFGGQAATLGSVKGPFTLANGNTLQITTGTGTATVTFASASFAHIDRASADEVVAAINAEPQVGAAGARAVVVDGRVVLQTLTQGTSSTISASGGTGLTALGWTAGQSATGQANAVTPEITGTYSGSTNETYTFVPTGDGTIGATLDLGVDVFDSKGLKVTTLAVGKGYVPETPITFANGLSVSFKLGAISSSSGHAASVDAVADADTSDVLAAFGLNAFATGTDAATIAIRSDIETDPSLLATSGNGANGDNGALLALARVSDAAMSGTDNQTLSTFYGALVVAVGSDASSTQSLHDTESVVMDGLEARRQSISGVNVDQELIDFERFQKSYSAAARFLSVVSQVQDELLRIV